MKEIVFGIDIGGTNTVFGAVDIEGNCLFEGRIPTQAYNSFPLYVEKIHDVYNQMVQNLNFSHKILGIGLGAPNGNFYTGEIDLAPNLPWKGRIEVRKEFAKYLDYRFGLPMMLKLQRLVR